MYQNYIKDFILIVCAIAATNRAYSQNATYVIEDKKLKIFENGKMVYSQKVDNGICSSVDLLKSQYSNEFYLYLENTCVSTIVKRLIKIKWQDRKFKIVTIETVKLKRDSIFLKSLYLDNHIQDTLDFNFEDGLTEKFKLLKSQNSMPVFFKDKNIGDKSLTKEQLEFEYPIFEKYGSIERQILLYNNIAFALYKNQSYEEAIAILKKVILYKPNRVVAYLNLADCYWESGNKSQARSIYKKYVNEFHVMNKKKKIPEYVYDRIQK